MFKARVSIFRKVKKFIFVLKACAYSNRKTAGKF